MRWAELNRRDAGTTPPDGSLVSLQATSTAESCKSRRQDQQHGASRLGDNGDGARGAELADVPHPGTVVGGEVGQIEPEGGVVGDAASAEAVAVVIERKGDGGAAVEGAPIQEIKGIVPAGGVSGAEGDGEGGVEVRREVPTDDEAVVAAIRETPLMEVSMPETGL